MEGERGTANDLLAAPSVAEEVRKQEWMQAELKQASDPLQGEMRERAGGAEKR